MTDISATCPFCEITLVTLGQIYKFSTCSATNLYCKDCEYYIDKYSHQYFVVNDIVYAIDINLPITLCIWDKEIIGFKKICTLPKDFTLNKESLLMLISSLTFL